ncbi:MAG: hypothetical protein GX181_04355 [Synergistaceae bacterium]|nr:hypothetical protein [Synergistota bacterium]NLM71182.1 hypothetical protein [Synergistaceae bacterium]
MEHISNIITKFIKKNMAERGLTLYRTDEKKIMALNDEYETKFKFDLVCTDNDFSCSVLSLGEDGLVMRKRFNVSWSDSEGIREFMDFVKGM